MSLAVRKRPSTFAEVVGNSATVTSLEAIVQRPEKPASFLFTGGSGCGKTTLSRILATELGATGRDFHEMNTADFRGIDTAREIIKQARNRPVHGKSTCKVWFFDECHKLTPDAQEAMLKLLEEPPRGNHFILATTEPDKLKPTFKRRCKTFTVQPIDADVMIKHMRRVMKKEGCAITKQFVEILEDICDRANGSLGIAMELLDSVYQLSSTEAAEVLKNMKGEQDQCDNLAKLLLSSNNWKTVATALKTFDVDPERARRGVLGYMSAVLLNGGKNMRAFDIMEAFAEPFFNTGKPGLVMASFEAVVRP